MRDLGFRAFGLFKVYRGGGTWPGVRRAKEASSFKRASGARKNHTAVFIPNLL